MVKKAITIWQPYAQATVLGLKHYETRSWKTNYRGDLIIHSSVRPMSESCLMLAKKYGFKDTPMGQILVLCSLEDCILIDEDFVAQQNKAELDFGDWKIGRYAWKLKIKKIYENGKKVKGKQGLWNVEI